LRKRFLLLPCILILSALALTACGSSGGEDGEIEEVIETSATTTDPADCKKLNTQQFMEQTTQESGSAAVKACEEEAKEEKRG
jgi:ABC-type oligopeptide transport system substrate-binding subunit